MNNTLDCYCPYCGQVLEVGQGPGTYQCEECNSAFTLHEMYFSCPHCDETILLDQGPGLYRCDSCGGGLNLGSNNKVKQVGTRNACVKCGTPMPPRFTPYIGSMVCTHCGSRICPKCRSLKVCPTCKEPLSRLK